MQVVYKVLLPPSATASADASASCQCLVSTNIRSHRPGQTNFTRIQTPIFSEFELSIIKPNPSSLNKREQTLLDSSIALCGPHPRPRATRPVLSSSGLPSKLLAKSAVTTLSDPPNENRPLACGAQCSAAVRFVGPYHTVVTTAPPTSYPSLFHRRQVLLLGRASISPSINTVNDERVFVLLSVASLFRLRWAQALRRPIAPG
ncbi:hypothetical protein LX32DRAFT_325315 [Colletotrichum zoysiae]|uniref:Uncharacterized protein n=1 Tax=Colletotrichum zoysiae TaxID=1216348 RepID=A0AAD9HMF2_9PEZI|nr:hypothetical protein LX32DRAFT_325315 [Colletotrichum zoysiae]